MYQVIEQVVGPDDFLRLREISGLSSRSYEAAVKGLPNSLYGVHIVHEGQVVGMGRVIGDGAVNFDIVDVAVDPAHQGNGLGRQIMECMMAYIDREAFPRSYVSLVADVPALYEKFGFQRVRPKSEGMYWVKK
ncbi:GNAT family N-acetyltransferase (plasmid) [Photobacterium sp. GJ3]|uniref:GNAT family N-acetyltransferase n=1 Tax=Photobacterium sp. GJ3 TaxID=2829502 RepID=UPI001B8BE0ED|nr:GNAT family N-acetyltransferase [Photobacterium sp. GJ3]QUJ70422.1 GNAT family N-acetyltransferase [Photobacterium sp. GJ3]